MQWYERRQFNNLINDKCNLATMLKDTIDSACVTIEQFVAEEKQKEAIKFFTKNMIHPTPIKESEEE